MDWIDLAQDRDQWQAPDTEAYLPLTFTAAIL
jgi:hypothetical protein